MPWTETTRRQYRRDDLRYASDMTDAEWALIEPHLPPPRPLGRPRTTDLRAVVDALLYMLASGCQWRLLPSDFPPYSTVQRFFYQWRADGLWQLINHDLMMRAREAQGRAASPSAGVIDSQSVKTTEAGGPRGFDAGKKIKGRKRHILTDTTGLMVAAMVHEASIQDRDGAVPLLASIRHRLPWLRHVFADGAYAGAKLEAALAALGRWTHRDRQALRRGQRLRAAATPLGGRAHAGVGQPQPPPRQGLRGVDRERHGLAPPGQRQTTYATVGEAIINLLVIEFRHLEPDRSRAT